MAKIALTIFSLKVSNSKEPQKVYELNKIKGKSLTDHLYSYLESLSKSYDDNNDESIYKVTNIEHKDFFYDDSHYCSCVNSIIKSGKYGIESEIVDKISGEVKFTKSVTDADVLPFGFSLMIPAQATEIGLLITQTFGIYGVTKLIKDLFSRLIKSINNDLEVNISNIMPNEYFRKLLENNHIKNIRLIKYTKDYSDKADYIDGKKFNLLDFKEIEQIYKQPSIGSKFKRLLFDSFTNRRDFNQIIGIENQTYDNIKIDFNINSSVKTVNYNGFSNLQVSEDITNEVTINTATGQPQIDSLYKEMNKTSIQYATLLKVLISVEEDKLISKVFEHLEEKIEEKES